MTEQLSPRELELLKPYLKLIDNQAKEITQLGMEVDTLRYNKRYTNTKFVKNEIKQLKPRTDGELAAYNNVRGLPLNKPYKEEKKK